MKLLLTLVLLSQSLSSVYAESAVLNEKSLNNEITVYRSPTCGCCSKWLAHLKQHNFKVTDKVTKNMDVIKQQYGVNAKLASCHTAIINGRVIEGHVPAKDIQKLLNTPNNFKGLSVPGMVVGSPGMEMGDKKAPYDVIAFDEKGNTTTYQSYR